MNRPRITRIEIIEFEETWNDIAPEPSIGMPIYSPGSTMTRRAHALKIDTNIGIRGEYIGGHGIEYAGIKAFARILIGRNALEREEIYNDVKQAMRQQARMGLGAVDIALWDIAGKFYNAPIYELLGGKPQPIPCYASTHVGDSHPDGLSSPEAYADFAEYCHSIGYRAFKIHGWQNVPVQQQIAVVEAVGKRMAGKMDLMVDPFCALRNFGDAIKLGRACDAYDYFWYEDPFKDGGVSAHAHRKLRHLIKTPLLQLEHVRGLESHVDFIAADATDFVRGDPDYDGGVTGVMKLAHAAEGFGLDVELHTPGPVRRHLFVSMRNTNYYEMGLLHPKIGTCRPRVYGDGYVDQIDSIDSEGCIAVPGGPGLGVKFDWDYIHNQKIGSTVFE